MRVAYLCQFFLPEPQHSKIDLLLNGLQENGHELTVITGFPNYPGGKLYPGYPIRPYRRETIKGWNVNRLPLYPSHDASSIGRALNYISFFLSSLIFGLWTGGRYDVVYAYHPPITVGLAAALFGWVRRVPFVIDIQDLWPESVVESSMAGTRRLERVIQWMCDFTYRRAAYVIVQCEGMRDKVVARGIDPAKVVVVYNWGNEEALAAPKPVDVPPLDVPGTFKIVVGGNIGRAQSLYTVVEGAAAAGKVDPRIQLIVVGDGTEKAGVRAHAERIGATNVHFFARMSQDEVADVYRRADVLVVSLTDQAVFRIVIPTRTQAYMLAAKPILMAVGGDAATLITRSGGGIAVAPENADAFAAGCLKLARMEPEMLKAMGNRARSFYDEVMSYRIGMAATLRLLTAAADRR